MLIAITFTNDLLCLISIMKVFLLYTLTICESRGLNCQCYTIRSILLSWTESEWNLKDIFPLILIHQRHKNTLIFKKKKIPVCGSDLKKKISTELYSVEVYLLLTLTLAARPLLALLRSAFCLLAVSRAISSSRMSASSFFLVLDSSDLYLASISMIVRLSSSIVRALFFLRFKKPFKVRDVLV